MVKLHVSLVSPRIILSFTKKIRVNPRDTLERFPIYPPLPPPFQEGAQFACHAIQVPPFGKGRLGGDDLPPRITRISTDYFILYKKNTCKSS